MIIYVKMVIERRMKKSKQLNKKEEFYIQGGPKKSL
jgi:hypothetical protein